MPGELAQWPSGAPARQVVDVSVLQGLVGDDPQVLRRFLAGYRAEAERLAQEMRAACDANDIRQVGAIAHKLKSSSRSIGALALGDLCAELENACRGALPEDIERGVMQFEAALQEVDAQIAALLDRPLAPTGT
jgi:HPt (histidine-containing phosphotransfer) domain-containing protein